MCKKHKRVCTALYYIEHLLILVSMITGCVLISAFACLVGVPIGIVSSTVGLKICVITAGMKQYMSITKIKRKKLDKIVFLAKTKLNSREILFLGL